MAKLPQKTKKQDNDRQPGLFSSVLPPMEEKSPLKFTNKLGDYLLDALGVVIIVASILLLIGSLGITQGAFIQPIVSFVTRWFGIGNYFIALSLSYLGVILIRWQKLEKEKLKLSLIIKVELAFFVLLGIFSNISNKSIFTDEVGANPGGVIGWGVAELFSALVGKVGALILLSIAFLILLASAFNVFTKSKRWVMSQLGEAIPEGAGDFSGVIAESPKDAVEEPSLREKTRANIEKRRQTLPKEFRKSFEVEDPKDVAQNGLIIERPDTLPPINLLDEEKSYAADKQTINMTAGLIEKTLADFGIPAKVVGYLAGPTVIQYAVEPGYFEKGNSDARYKIRISQISNLKKDLTLALRAERLRIEAPVPGKSYVGIEVPHSKASIVHLKPLLGTEEYSNIKSKLIVPIGRSVSGKPIGADLANMPHLLIGGTTGSGKSVFIAALTTCLLMNNTPETLRLVMIDPKLVELNRFNGTPHLLGNVEVETERILAVLRWAVAEMEMRFKILAPTGAKDLDSYNNKMKKQRKPILPRIVIIIDELADLMMTVKDQTEGTLVRLAQKSRAVGIHLVVATQRPSIDVVTGLIKANFPTRIAFNVASSIDSRVILDAVGAETLLGKGDMLYSNQELGNHLIRSQGVMVSDQEMERVIEWWQAEEKKNKQNDDAELAPWEEDVQNPDDANADDRLIDKAIEILQKDGKASASYLQRQLRIGYPRAARLMDQLEERGIIGPSQGGGKERDILLDDEDGGG